MLFGSPLLLVCLIWLGAASRERTYRVSGQRLSYAKAFIGDFQDIASFQGTVEPMKTVLLDATEGGVVEEIMAENGAMVEAGQPLLRLSNTSLRLDFMNRETQIVEQINNLRSTRINLEQNKRQVQEQLLDIEFQRKEQARQWQQDSQLFSQKALSLAAYKASQARLQYLQRKEALLLDRLSTDERYRQSQLGRIDASVDMMERNLAAIRQNLESLVLKAPISGQLNSFDHELGQTKSRGERLGRIDQLEQYAISAKVDQYYLDRVRLGQQANLPFAGLSYVVEVAKIFPTVVNGQFELRLHFVDGRFPEQLRRGQSLPVKLKLSANRQALLLPRGAFSQGSTGSHVFVRNGNEAEKRQVRLGSQNPDYIEVLEGLSPGEEIISSSYRAFGEAERIVITP